MLSHRVGRSNRADLARLSELETALDAGAEKAARQEERLRRAADEKTALRKSGNGSFSAIPYKIPYAVLGAAGNAAITFLSDGLDQIRNSSVELAGGERH